jgi:hypothetical protein
MEFFQYFSRIPYKPALNHKLGRFIFYFFIKTILIFGLNITTIEAQPKPEEGYQIIKDLNDDWLVFDANYKDYVPYLKTRHFNYKSHSQYLDIENYKGYKLFLYLENDSFLFVNGTFQKKIKNGLWIKMNLDSLAKTQKLAPKILFTIYSENPDFEKNKIHIAYKAPISKINQLGNNDKTALKSRIFSNFKNFAILFSLLLFGSITFLYNFQNNLLLKFISINNLFSIGKRGDTAIVNRPFDIANVLYMIILSFSIALILLILEYNFVSILPKFIINTENPTFLNLSGQFFNLSFLAFLAFLVKYVFISLIGNLYKLDKITNLHFFKNLQSTGIFSFTLLLILVLLLLYPVSEIQNYKATYISIITFFYFIRLFLLFFIIIKSNSIKNLYLFSYLCIVELIPIFIGVRFAL